MAIFGAPVTDRVTGTSTGSPGMFEPTTILPFRVVVPKSPASIVTVKSWKLSGAGGGGDGGMIADTGATLSQEMAPVKSATTLTTRGLPPRFTTCRVRVVDDPVSRVALNDSGLTIICGGGDEVPSSLTWRTGAFAASLLTVRL